MPGISTIITDSIEIKKKFKSYNRVLNHEEYFYTKDLLDSKKINSFINLHESYPSYTFEYDKYLSLKFTIKFLIETEPFLNKLYCLLKKENLNNKKELISIVEDYSHQEKYIDYLLANKEELNSLSEQELMRIITIFMYLNEFTTKHNKEVIINEK